LIFLELVAGTTDKKIKNPPVAYMIDASHNVKDPLEDLMQSLENILNAYTKASLVDFKMLAKAQQENDVAGAERILQMAFQSDVRPLLAEARLRSKGCLDPIDFFRSVKIREALVDQRGKKAVATGL
jgi:L-rhamnose isomerase/sugar isomerase